jgi:hypothetical protein
VTVAKPKSTIRVGMSKSGKVVTTKKGSGLLDKALKAVGK